jgi:hypothetical protein
MMLADRFLNAESSPLAAYNALQRALMRHYIARGRSAADWCSALAPAFRRRYGWILEARS